MEDTIFKVEHLGTWARNCYIFTADRIAGLDKLHEIEKKKQESGIFPSRRSEKCISFDDGENWAIVNPNHVHRLCGIRWYKCFVDASSVTVKAHHFIAARTDSSRNLEEDMMLFNW